MDSIFFVFSKVAHILIEPLNWLMILIALALLFLLLSGPLQSVFQQIVTKGFVKRFKMLKTMRNVFKSQKREDSSHAKGCSVHLLLKTL